MDTETAKNIGTKLAIKSISIGVIIAYLLMGIGLSGVQTSFFEGLFWIIRIRSEAVQNFLIVIGAFYACGYYFGGKAGIAILAKQRSYLWVGPRWGLFTLLSTAFFASILGYSQVVIRDMYSMGSASKMSTDLLINNFTNFISWVVFYILIFGLIPALLVGLWFGWKIKRTVKLA